MTKPASAYQNAHRARGLRTVWIATGRQPRPQRTPDARVAGVLLCPAAGGDGETESLRCDTAQLCFGSVEEMGSLLLLVATPFYQPDRPAARFHAAFEPPLAHLLRAAMGARLRARGALLGRCLAGEHCQQGQAKHGNEGGRDDKACHHSFSPKCRSRPNPMARLQ